MHANLLTNNKHGIALIVNSRRWTRKAINYLCTQRKLDITSRYRPLYLRTPSPPAPSRAWNLKKSAAGHLALSDAATWVRCCPQPNARRPSLAIANRAFRKSSAAAFRASSTGSACWAKRGRVRQDLLWRGILPIIPPEANRREPPARDFRRYRDRNQVERVLRYK